MASSPSIQAFFDEATYTVSYLVSDPVTRAAAVIDPVLDYDHRTGNVATLSADRILATAAQHIDTQGIHFVHRRNSSEKPLLS